MIELKRNCCTFLLVFVPVFMFGCTYNKKEEEPFSLNDTRQGKTVLTMATDFYTFEDEVNEFNLSSEDYFIEVVLFDNEEDFFHSIDMGEIPDFYSFMPSISGYKAIDPMKLSAKGMLTDLYEFIDQDEEISRESFIPGLFSITEFDSALYQLPSSFYITSVAGNANIIGEHIVSLEKLLALMKQYEVEYPFGPNESREWLASYILSEFYYEFMDWESMSGNVNTELFRNILELIKLQPGIEEISVDGEIIEVPHKDVIEQTQCLLCPVTISSIIQFN